ncbi:separase [Prunus yedoensis var. nudiflora]|uniref:Separase n=1 Tax=Prunus yedoensis var. nudiflora TaxID=2094558 RepID=A0A314UWY2_PRUYE|nr:separase [Prunus yedoensis var. nudiflora]
MHDVNCPERPLFLHDQFEGGAYVSQLCFKKGCYIGKAGCSEEEKCLTSPGESNGIEKQSELAFQLIHEAVNELEGLCSVNREPIILVLDFEVQMVDGRLIFVEVAQTQKREEDTKSR